MFSQLASKFAFFPPSPATYQIRKGEGEGEGRLRVVSTAAGAAVEDSLLDVLMIDTKRGNKIVGFYLRNPCARLTLLYSHGNAADLGQLYDLFLQLKVNLRVNLMGFVLFLFSLLCWSQRFVSLSRSWIFRFLNMFGVFSVFLFFFC